MKEIELPFDFNASDSDLEEYRISIPKGFEAEINKDNVVLKKIKNEDDNIRQKLIKLIKMSNEIGVFALHKWEADEMLNWLEKQDKTIDTLTPQEAMDIAVAKCFEYGEQKPTDKVEPKFNVGDWIVFNGFVLHVYEIVDCYYRTTSIVGICNSYDWAIDNVARLWTIQDAKDGDVLYLKHDGKEHIIIYKGVIKERFRTFVSAYCAYNGIVDAFCFADVSRYVDIAYGSIMPATKEQRNTLTKAMADAGYTFDFDKKELKKIKL